MLRKTQIFRADKTGIRQSIQAFAIADYSRFTGRADLFNIFG